MPKHMSKEDKERLIGWLEGKGFDTREEAERYIIINGGDSKGMQKALNFYFKEITEYTQEEAEIEVEK